jgi:hypothetical protein
LSLSSTGRPRLNPDHSALDVCRQSAFRLVQQDEFVAKGIANARAPTDRNVERTLSGLAACAQETRESLVDIRNQNVCLGSDLQGTTSSASVSGNAKLGGVHDPVVASPTLIVFSKGVGPRPLVGWRETSVRVEPAHSAEHRRDGHRQALARRTSRARRQPNSPFSILAMISSIAVVIGLRLRSSSIKSWTMNSPSLKVSCLMSPGL